MNHIFNVADLRDPDDPAGRSRREVNAEKTHAIPVGALVEDVESGVRLFVVHHGRDCDQTPLYWLCHDPSDTVQERPGWMNKEWIGGYAERYLEVVRLPGEEQGTTP